MADSQYSAADYLAALQALFPRGLAWPRSPEAVNAIFLGALAKTFARGDGRAMTLLVEAFPKTTYELLPEWEETLGLPDPCAGASPTIQQRRAQVVARFAIPGGQSVQHIKAYARALGYQIEVTQFTLPKAGHLRAGQPLCGRDWAHTWLIDAPATTSYRFAAGRSAAGEALRVTGNEVLECELREIAPAHTLPLFRYGVL